MSRTVGPGPSGRGTSGGDPPGRVERGVIGLAVRLLPAAFRGRFGAAMVDAVFDGLAERRGIRRGVFLVRSAVGVVRAGARERLAPTPLPSGPGASRDRGSLTEVLAQELRFALRALRRRPGFTLVAVTTLALGIAANSAIFSVVNGVLLRPLPFPDPDGLRMVWAWDMDGEPGRGSMSKPDLEDIAGLPAVAGVEGYASANFTLTGGDRPTLVVGAQATGGLMDILGVAPYLGRDLRHEESVPSRSKVVVVSYGFWQGRLGGRPDVLGSTLELSRGSYEIVGVAAPGFDFPEHSELWIPSSLDPEGCGRGCHVFRGVLRLAPGTPAGRLESELQTLAARLGEAYPDSNFHEGFRAESLMNYRVGDVRRGLWLLLGAVGVVLLIACANVANLLLVRGAGRRSEVAVRAALGAGPVRVMVNVMGESAVLAAAGTGMGLGLTWLAVWALRRVPTGTVPRIDEVAMDGRVLAFTVGVGMLVTLLFGLAPALHLAGSAPGRVLRSGHGGAHDHRESRSRSLLLAGEMALSVILLSGAGLFLRSLAELRSVDLGFSERAVTRFTLSVPESRYATLSDVAGFYRHLEDRLAAVPGVDAVGSAFGPPLSPYRITGEVRVEGEPEPAPGDETTTSVHPATPGYFRTLGIPPREGRVIESTDREDAEPVAVVSETFARENFPGRSPVGQRVGVSVSFGYGSPEWWTVVGVVPDLRHSLTEEPGAEIYLPQAQLGPGFMTVHLRGSAPTNALVAAARDIVHDLDPDIPLAGVETLRQALAHQTAVTRFYLTLVGIFAGLAVALAAVGLYGVVSYVVARRTREIGIRVALGAGTGRVRGMVVLQGLEPALVGLAVGVVGLLTAGGAVESALGDVARDASPRDPVMLAAVVALLLAVSVLATLVPARRATRVDPCEALRQE